MHPICTITVRAMRVSLWLVPLAVLVLLNTHCGFAGSSDMDSGLRPSAYDTGPTTDTDTGASITTPETLGAAWFGLSDTLTVTDGTLDPEGTVLTIHYWGDESTDLSSPLCTATYTVSAELGTTPDPEVEMVAWWTLTLRSPSACSNQPYPNRFGIGLGPYDPLLASAVDRAGIDPTTLNGLYYQQGPGTALYVFGLAGTAAQFDGTEGPTAEPPIPDGVYTLLTLYALPLNE